MSTRYVYAMKIEAPVSPSGNTRGGWLIYSANGNLLGFGNHDMQSTKERVFTRVIDALASDRPHDDYSYEVIELGIVSVPFKEYRYAKDHRQF